MSAPTPSDAKPELVLLLRALWRPDKYILQDIIRRKFKKRVKVHEVDEESSDGDKGSTEFIMGDFPTFFAQFDGFMFIIHTIPDAYFQDRKAAAEATTELRAVKAIKEHEAYISVTLMMAPPDADLRTRQLMVGRMTAGLGWSPDTLALLDPGENLIRVWDKKLRKALRELPAAEAIRTCETTIKTTPVFRAEPNDEDFAWAGEQAQRRLPDFLAAFARREPDGPPFCVKAPCKEGDEVEHMWIEVLNFEDGILEGKLLNDGVNLKRYKSGVRLRLKPKLVNDLLFKDGDTLVGPFMEEALRRRMRRQEEQQAPPEADEDDLDDDLDEEPEDEPAPEPAAAVNAPAPRAPARRPAPPDEDDEEEPRPPAKRRRAPDRSSNKLLWVLLACGGGVLLVGGVVLAIVLSGGSPADKNTAQNNPGNTDKVNTDKANPARDGNPKPPQRTGGFSGDDIANRFARALEKRDFEAAYACTSSAFQARHSLADFRKQIEDSKILEGKLPFQLRWQGQATAERGVVQLRHAGDQSQNPPALEVAAVHDAGWWIGEILRISPFKPGPEPPKETGPRGAGSSAIIVHSFATALQKRDFKAAYECTTAGYRRRHSLADFRKKVEESKVLEGKLPFRQHAHGQPTDNKAEVNYFYADARFGAPPALRVTAVRGASGWLIDDINWKPK
jgi:uncharacterized protein YegJ (DUF2314 family)